MKSTLSLEGLIEHIQSGAHEGAFGLNPRPTPTEAQCRAGNYKVGRIQLYGMDIAIEQPQGSYRSGKDASTGKPWRTRLDAHYGYFSGTKGADDDPVDCFVGFYPQADTAYIINQHVGGAFDEHKVMAGYPDENSARAAYLNSYERGWGGLHSLVPVSITQLKWWLKHGDTKRPIAAENLPYEGLESMNIDRISWDGNKPRGMSLGTLLYEIHRADDSPEQRAQGTNRLIFDSATMADILEDSDGGAAILDAMVVQMQALERKAGALQSVMIRYGQGGVKPVAMQVSEPFTKAGKANIAVIYELSDGQTVTIYFHNPDVKAKKLQPGDELTSWKWMLNKKDITIVVAPERGKDLDARMVAQRVMAIAEKNSQAFGRANAKRADTMRAIEGLKEEITQLEGELESVQHELEVAKLEAESRGSAQEQGNAMGEDAPKGDGAADVFVEPAKPFDTYLNEAGGDSFVAARAFFKAELQGRYVNTVIGDVYINGASWKEMKRGMKSDPIKIKVLPHVAEILSGGRYDGKQGLNKERSDSFVAFHFFENEVDIGEFVATAGVTVGERASGYKMLAYGLGHSMERSWKLKEAGLLARGEEPRVPASSNDDNVVLDSTVDQAEKEINEGLNIVILKVVDKEGNRRPELEDDVGQDGHEKPTESESQDEFSTPAEQKDFDPTSPEGYAQVMADPVLQEEYQDKLDAFFQERIVAVRSALHELGWEGRKPNDTRLYKQDEGAELQPSFTHVGAGNNVAGWDMNGIADDLTKAAEEYAAQVDAAAMADAAPHAQAVKDAEQAPSAENDLAPAPAAVQATRDDAVKALSTTLAPDAPEATQGQDDAVIALTGTELGNFPDTKEGKKGMRKAAEKEYYALISGGVMVPCPALSSDVELRTKGLKKVLSQSGDTRKLQIIPRLKDLIQSAQKVGNEKPNYDRANSPNIVGYQTMRSLVRIGGNDLAVRFVLGRDDKGIYHYDHTIHQAEAIFDSANSNGPAEASPSDAMGGNQGFSHSRSAVPGPACLLSAEPSAEHRVDSILDDAGDNVKDRGGNKLVFNLFIEGEEPEVLSDDGVLTVPQAEPIHWEPKTVGEVKGIVDPKIWTAI